ncbi:hypothetical protein CPB85DRAFT_1251189 [Mucidula mucida]|nr:hypothetical protein CPB85DRAFT_1251189 [Mucidula mucida]
MSTTWAPLSPYMNVSDVEEYGMIFNHGQLWDSETQDLFGSQLPTPPPDELSHSPSPSTAIIPSATFHADLLFGLSHPDLRILSSDSHLFHVHKHVLLRSSENNFADLLTKGAQEALVHIPETAMVLSILFAAIYGIKLADIYPIDTLIHAIDLFPRYGVQPKAYVWPSASIYQAIRDQTPLAPFQVYALASRYDLEELAVAASQYLLNLCLQSITDEMTDLVHPKYLLRLFHLHSKRKDTLRNILSEPLETHSPTLSCNYLAYERLQRAWFLAVACLLWDAHANMSISVIQSTLLSLQDGLKCNACRRILTARVKSIVVQWSEAQVV